MGRGAAEDAALAEGERRGGWVADGGYAALVPCATGEGWIGGERFNGGLGVAGFHDEFSFQVLATKNTKVTKRFGNGLIGGTLGEDGGDFGFVEGEAGAGGGEGGGKLRVVFAEVLGGNEEIVVAEGVELVADGWPEVAGHERVDEAQLAEGARRRNDGHELEHGLYVRCRFGVAANDVFLPFRRIGGRLVGGFKGQSTLT